MSEPRILVGHACDVLDGLAAQSVHACITSPPYFRLREYGCVVDWPEIHYPPMPDLPSLCVPAQRCELGLEDDLSDYVGHLVHVFRSVHRVLRPEGTVWLNLGDSWASSGKRGPVRSGFNERWHGRAKEDPNAKNARVGDVIPSMIVPAGIKRKDLLGVPWRVAFALQADGWWLRSEVIWEKPNALPDPTEDRVTRSHETIFHLTKSPLYFHDPHAIRENHVMRPQRRPNGHKRRRTGPLLPEHTFEGSARDEPGIDGHPLGRNCRSVWTIPTQPFLDAHFAVMTSEVARRCVLASTSAKGVCPSCHAPHRRVVELDESSATRRKADGHPCRYGTQGTASNKRGFELTHPEDRAAGGLGRRAKVVSVGWEPTCSCNAGDPIPATVLDPFSGAATTGLLALAEGRAFLGVEFNERYAEMSLRRLRAEGSQRVMFGDDGTSVPR